MFRSSVLTCGILAAVAAVVGSGVSTARADMIFTGTGVGTADFSLINGNTQLQVVLTNTGTNTKQGTAISGVEFAVSGFTLGALTSATATDGMIISPYTSITAGSVGQDILKADGGRWEALSVSGNDPNRLTALSGTQPEELILSNSISSNGGTDNFDPYVSQVGTFIYNISGVGASPSIGDSNSEVIFQLGTGPDTSPASDPGVGSLPPRTPEPASLSLLGLGAAGLLLRRRPR